MEVRDRNGSISGSYHVLLPDGRHQYVTYKDEGNGFVVDIQYQGEENGHYATPATNRPVVNKKPIIKNQEQPSYRNSKPAVEVVRDTKRGHQKTTEIETETQRKSTAENREIDVPESYKKSTPTEAQIGTKRLINKEEGKQSNGEFFKKENSSGNTTTQPSNKPSTSEHKNSRKYTEIPKPNYNDEEIVFNPPVYKPTIYRTSSSGKPSSSKLAVNKEVIRTTTNQAPVYHTESHKTAIPSDFLNKGHGKNHTKLHSARPQVQQGPVGRRIAGINRAGLNRIKVSQKSIVATTASYITSDSKSEKFSEPVLNQTSNQEQVSENQTQQLAPVATKLLESKELVSSNIGTEIDSTLKTYGIVGDEVLTTPRYKIVMTTTPIYKIYKPPPYRVLDKSLSSSKGQIYKESYNRAIID